MKSSYKCIKYGLNSVRADSRWKNGTSRICHPSKVTKLVCGEAQFIKCKKPSNMEHYDIQYAAERTINQSFYSKLKGLI